MTILDCGGVNAAATIERAIASCLGEAGAPILLIDDHSTDDTVARAVAVAGPRLRVVRVPAEGVSAARQAGLDAVETDFAAWLDADDEWVPGRLARLEAMLRAGHDVATEAIDLHDGPSGAWLQRLTVPAFARGARGAVRLFERNVLPGDTQVAFRASAYREATPGLRPDDLRPREFSTFFSAPSVAARGSSVATKPAIACTPIQAACRGTWHGKRPRSRLCCENIPTRACASCISRLGTTRAWSAGV